ncbi:hypothetical protein NA57DRAFT_81188 [Rhizodiscina lignyota]|uniref:Uncharacterized protein n=1 Tax=Rhizodiscina lignyota TaxID=1504668 RepID=A0A9P4M1P3_9PEZI|nr:hypothetical protein NA57DRAFT_81188 [Rhizodiscina lignyota]
MSFVTVLTFRLLALFVGISHALELQPIRQGIGHNDKHHSFDKRDFSALDLSSAETFLWGAPGQSETTIANLTVFMPGDNENILSLEKLNSVLTAVHCYPSELALGFESDSSFAYAKGVWDWVNGADNHTFLLVAGAGDCGRNSRRIPYQVSSISYDEARNVAHLHGTEGSWKDLAHTYEMHVGRVPMSDSFNVTKRDYTKDETMDLNHDLSFQTTVSTGPLSGTLVCNPCGTTGTMDFDFTIKTTLLIPTDVQLQMQLQGVSAYASIKLTATSNFGTKIPVFRKSLFKIPLDGISIPEILTFGPAIDIQVGADFTPFEGSISLLTGATATIPDDSFVQVDLLDPSNDQGSGWSPSISTQDTTIQAQADMDLKAFFMPSLELEAEVLGIGLETGLQFQMPYVDVKAAVIDSPGGGACSLGDSYQAALKVTPTWGFAIKFNAGTVSGVGPIDITLGNAAWPIGNPLCYGFDPVSSSPTTMVTSVVSTSPSPTGAGPSPSSGFSSVPFSNSTVQRREMRVRS